MRCFEELISEGAAAIIFCAGSYCDYGASVDFARQNSVPLVLVGIEFPVSFCLPKIEVDAGLCGRIAAEFLENSLDAGSGCAIVIGSRDTPPHAEKLAGFSNRVQAAGKLKFCGSIEVRDNNDAAYFLMRDMLDRHAELKGIYTATAILDGVYQAVSESGRSGEIIIIATDLNSRARSGSSISSSKPRNPAAGSSMRANPMSF